MTVRNILEHEETIIQKRRLTGTWFGHVERMEDNRRLPHKALHCYIEGVRSRGRQRKPDLTTLKKT